MTLTRRGALGLLAMAGLASCAGGASAPKQTTKTVWLVVPDAGFDAWLAGFRSRALAQGVSPATFDAAFRETGFIPAVIEKDRNQTEFTRTTEDYLAIAASEERVALGRKDLARYGSTLDQIEARYGVEKETVAAVWGMESFYGTRRGDAPVVGALATLGYEGRRGQFFEQQLIAALKILQNGDVSVDGMTGSWAGAMGHTQFIPTSYLAYAVDFNGDGRRDIWSDDPTDALASTASYLKRSGWTYGQPAVVEVKLPAGFNTAQAGRGKGKSPSAWAAQGVRDMNGKVVPDYGTASILLPAGPTGPAFMLFNNFNVILRYNNAENYALGIGHLASRLAGGPPVRGTFPPDKYGMTIQDRREMQELLTAAGYDTNGADGVVGPATLKAIAAYQQASGLPVTGEPSLVLLASLR